MQPNDIINNSMVEHMQVPFQHDISQSSKPRHTKNYSMTDKEVLKESQGLQRLHTFASSQGQVWGRQSRMGSKDKFKQVNGQPMFHMRSSGRMDSGIFVADETGIMHNSSQNSPPITRECESIREPDQSLEPSLNNYYNNVVAPPPNMIQSGVTNQSKYFYTLNSYQPDTKSSQHYNSNQ